ncbi:hypothetical protein ZWY2020_054277 [Hordeum vulgare]|nr:hypothetical protein ZWY2020_054277 [Hordeum vulgare]
MQGEEEAAVRKKRIRVITRNKKKKKQSDDEEGKGGGILTCKLFSHLYMSHLTAKAITEMNYTHLTQVEDFAKFTFGNNEERQRKRVYVGVDDSELKPTVEGLQQGYILCHS